MRFQLIRVLGLITLLGNAEMAQALVPTNWLARVSGTAKDLQGVAYGRGRFVAVGQQGLALTSTDGSNWTARATGVAPDLTGITYGRGLFVAVGKAATVITSADGLSWAAATKVPAGDLAAIAFGGGQFVAVGTSSDTAYAALSTDGLKWTRIDSGLSWQLALSAVAYGNQGFLAAGNSGATYALTSFEYAGEMNYKWRAKGTLGPIWIAGLAFGRGRYIACAAEGLWFSDDGQNWTASDAGNGYAVIGGNDHFVAARRFVYASSNGRTWWPTHPFISPPSASQDLLGIAYGNNSYVAVGRGGTIVQTGPAAFASRPGGRRDHPYAWFDTSDRPAARMGLPEYRVNTTSLNLVLESTLFFMKTVGAPVELRLTYNGDPNATNGMFGPGWRLAYEASLNPAGNQVLLSSGSGKTLVYEVTNNLGSATADLPVALAPAAGVFDRLTWNGAAWLWQKKLTRWVYRFDPTTPNGPAHLSSITDRNGNLLSLGRDPQAGRLQWIEDPARRRVLFAYDQNLHCSTITVPDGRKLQFAYDAQGRLTRITDMAGYVGTYRYDADGFMTESSTAGFTSKFTWVPRPGFPGDKCVAAVEDAQKEVTRYAVDPAGYGPVTQTLPGGQVRHYQGTDGNTSAVQDPMNQTREALYDQNLPVQATDSLGQVIRQDYDARGNVLQVVDAQGQTYRFAYDSRDNLISRSNPLKETTTYRYDSHDNLVEAKSPLGATQVFEYDPRGRLLSVRDPNGHSLRYEHDDFGNITRLVDAGGAASEFSYDPWGLRCTRMMDARQAVKRLSYDDDDRIVRLEYLNQVTPLADLLWGNDYFGLSVVTNETGAVTRYERNPLGSLTQIQDPLGNLTVREYDTNRNLVALTDALKRRRTMEYDDAGHLTAQVDARGLRVIRTYDAEGNLTSLADQRQQTNRFTYDANNHLLTTRDPLNRTVQFTRDALGRIAQTLNARGQKITSVYDADGRLLSKSYDGRRVAAYTYDLGGNLVRLEDDTGVTTYQYGDRNELTAVTYPDSPRIQLAYDPSGNVTNLVYPDGTVVNSTYDAFNRMHIPSLFHNVPAVDASFMSEKPNQPVTVQWQGATLQCAYDAGARLIREARANGTTTEYGYDANGRCTNLVHKSGAGVLAGSASTYDAVGRCAREDHDPPQVPPLPVPVNRVVYNEANQVVDWGTDHYTYDEDGNLLAISGGKFAAVYDPENRLVRVIRGGTNVDFTYNGMGDLVKRTSGAETRWYHYDRQGRLWFETDAGGTVTANHIYAGGRLVARGTMTTGYRYYHSDRIGSILALTDAAGVVTVRYSYGPHGAKSTQGNDDGNPFTFVGAYGVMDEGNGLFLMKNRHYDASSGRFLQKDPLGFAGGQINLYAYAGNNPVDRVDPKGLMTDEDLAVDPADRYKNLYDPVIHQQVKKEITSIMAAADVTIGSNPKIGKAYGLVKMLYTSLTYEKLPNESEPEEAANKFARGAYDFLQLINPYDTLVEFMAAKPVGETEEEIRQACPPRPKDM